MNRRFISVLMFAFVVAAGASFALYKMINGRISEAAPVPTTTILVATKTLEIGTVIREEDLRESAWPGVTPQGSIGKRADALGRGVTAAIFEGEPVTSGRLGAVGAGGGLAVTIPQGMRAVAIRVNEVVGVAGFVIAGTHVDVLASGSTPDSDGTGAGSSTRTLLQNISVLSAGQDFKKDNEGKPVTVQVVNLLVTPAQAEMLSLASNQMTIQLVLRNPTDTAIAVTPGVSLATIFSGQKPRPVVRSSPLIPATMPVRTVMPTAPPRPPEAPRMEIITGSKRAEIQLHQVSAW